MPSIGLTGTGDDVLDYGPDKEGIAALASRLVEDGKAYARAEIGYAKAAATERVRAAKTGAIFLVVALVLAHGALIALFVGAVLALATLVGPLWATVIVVLAACAIAAVLAKIGISHFQAAKQRPVADGGVEP